jgi:hypothetical protein
MCLPWALNFEIRMSDLVNANGNRLARMDRSAARKMIDLGKKPCSECGGKLRPRKRAQEFEREGVGHTKQIRNPKHETRNRLECPKRLEARNGKVFRDAVSCLGHCLLSDFEFVSNFEIRISDLVHASGN